jgi:hypothetical protein
MDDLVHHETLKFIVIEILASREGSTTTGLQNPHTPGTLIAGADQADPALDGKSGTRPVQSVSLSANVQPDSGFDSSPRCKTSLNLPANKDNKTA